MSMDFMDYEMLDIDDDYSELYYRVECIDTKKNVSCGGYMSALSVLLSLVMNIKPNEIDETLDELLSESDDPNAKIFASWILILGDIPVPKIYSEDKDNKYCFYREDEFDEVYGVLYDLSEMLDSCTGGAYKLMYKCCDILDDDILYGDEYQIVVSKETYENAFEIEEYEEFCD